MTARMRGTAPKPIVVRALVRVMNVLNTCSTCVSDTSATLNIALPRCWTSCGSRWLRISAASASPSIISRIAAASLPSGPEPRGLGEGTAD
jgi:hypothetical protein